MCIASCISQLWSDELTKYNLPLFLGDENTLKLDEFADGLQGFMKTFQENRGLGMPEVYEFFTRYVRRVHLDTHWKRAMKNNANKVFFLLVTSSNIAFVISLLKNGTPVWNRKKALSETEEMRKAKATQYYDDVEELPYNFDRGNLRKVTGLRNLPWSDDSLSSDESEDDEKGKEEGDDEDGAGEIGDHEEEEKEKEVVMERRSKRYKS